MFIIILRRRTGYLVLFFSAVRVAYEINSRQQVHYGGSASNVLLS